MNVYMILFFLGFMLAVGLLAYTSMQVEKLNRKTEQFSKDLQERYSKPLKGFEEEAEKEKENKEVAPVAVAHAPAPVPAAENKA